MVQIRA